MGIGINLSGLLLHAEAAVFYLRNTHRGHAAAQDGKHQRITTKGLGGTGDIFHTKLTYYFSGNSIKNLRKKK